MSRTTLCVLTAAALAAVTTGFMTLRRVALGDEVGRPFGPGCWKVTLSVQGTSTGGARVMTATPLDLDRQHVLVDRYESTELAYKPPEARHPQRRQVIWTQRGAAPAGLFHARCTFQVAVESSHPNALMTRLVARPVPAARPAAASVLELAPGQRPGRRPPQ